MVEAPISVSVHHGNTLKVARAMAQELGAKVLKPGNIFPEVIRSVSLIDLDSSIYLGAHHRFLIKLVKDNTNLFRDKPVFIFYASIIRKFRLLTGVTKCLSIN